MNLRSPSSHTGSWFRPRLRYAMTAAAFALAAFAPSMQAQTAQTFCQAQVIGNRRIPKESVLARLFEHQGDAFDQSLVERDFNSLWNTGYFEDIRIERVNTPECVQMVVYVREKPTIREINYKGLNAVTESDVLERFKKAKVGLTVESQYDPTRIKKAEVVLKGLLAEHGHQFATIKTEVKTMPPASVAVTFGIKEGPTVKVGKIHFEGNQQLNARTLRAAMKNSKPIGIPHSIFLENIFPRTFDATKLDEDAERVRQAYRDRGYFKAQTGEPKTHVRDAGGVNLLLMPSHGKRIDILMPIEEGQRYRLGGINFTNYKDKDPKALRASFAQKDGEWFNATLFGKGLENLRKAYGSLGYINFVGTPTPRFDEANHKLFLDIDLDEGKKFYVSRIEFQGNTVTRDRVIRRELLLEEGQQYNNNLWEMSILRLNQLNYFETLKADQDSETKTNADEGTVDLLLKLKEKGKNSIGLNGGISGMSGSFIGLNYETNNFLGLGETLSLQANAGDLSRNLTLGFNEPYFRNKPIALGFQVFSSKYDYNPAKSYGAQTGVSQNLSNAQRSLLTNYNQSQTGLTLSVSYPIRRSFKRIGVSYSLTKAGITTFNDNTRGVFEALAFRSGIQGQNQLQDIVTSTITPSFSYSSIDRAVGPHSGTDFNVALQVAGAGGNVKFFSPAISLRKFYPMKGLHISRDGHNVLAGRVQIAHVEGFGGQVAPPFNRVYAGGESDIRGFDVRSASPYTFIPVKTPFNLTNADGSVVHRDPNDYTQGSLQVPLPIYRLSSVGGDTSITANLEYRIPLGNSVTFDFFTDFNMTFDALKSQLRQSDLGQSQINSPLYGCPIIDNGACKGGRLVSFPRYLETAPGTNFVPRMSNGIELQVILPIVNAPFRIYYAYNPLRLYEDLTQKEAVDKYAFNDLFPKSDASCVSHAATSTSPEVMCGHTGAGATTYRQASQYYLGNYTLREPRKTLRLTVSTTF